MLTPNCYKTEELRTNIEAIYESTLPAVEVPLYINWYMMYLYNNKKNNHSLNEGFRETGWLSR